MEFVDGLNHLIMVLGVGDRAKYRHWGFIVSLVACLIARLSMTMPAACSKVFAEYAFAEGVELKLGE